MQSLKKKKLIIANSVLMLLLLVGFVYAWFAVNYNNDVTSYNVTVHADGALELSLTGLDGSWKPDIDLSSSDWYNKVKFTDVTGSGDGNFLRPALDQFDGYATVNSSESSTWTTPAANSDYVKFTLYMRSDEPLDVSLGNGSCVDPVDGTLKGTTSTDIDEISNKSTLSDNTFAFSKDIIVGAVRVSAVNSEDTHLFTWIPRPDIYFNSTGEGTTYSDSTIMTGVTKGTVSGDPSFIHQYYASKSATMTPFTGNLVTSDITEENNNVQPLCTLVSSGDYYVGQVDFYIWIEGCDNEARRAFVGGKFNVDMNLVSEEIAVSDSGTSE